MFYLDTEKNGKAPTKKRGRNVERDLITERPKFEAIEKFVLEDPPLKIPSLKGTHQGTLGDILLALPFRGFYQNYRRETILKATKPITLLLLRSGSGGKILRPAKKKAGDDGADIRGSQGDSLHGRHSGEFAGRAVEGLHRSQGPTQGCEEEHVYIGDGTSHTWKRSTGKTATLANAKTLLCRLSKDTSEATQRSAERKQVESQFKKSRSPQTY